MSGVFLMSSVCVFLVFRVSCTLYMSRHPACCVCLLFAVFLSFPFDVSYVSVCGFYVSAFGVLCVLCSLRDMFCVCLLQDRLPKKQHNRSTLKIVRRI